MDYASVMQYPPYLIFRAMAVLLIETIPRGHSVEQCGRCACAGEGRLFSRRQGGYRAPLWGTADSGFTVTSNPVGLSVLVDGETVYQTPQTYSWPVELHSHAGSGQWCADAPRGDIENSATSSHVFITTYGRWNDSTNQKPYDYGFSLETEV